MTAILFGLALHCSLSAFSQSRIQVLDSIALPEEYILNIDPEGSGYVGLATVRAEGALCGGQSAWIELDSSGQITRFIPFILSNGKGTCAYQYFKWGEEIYTFHPNNSSVLYRWTKDIREIGEIPIDFPNKGRYQLTMHNPLTHKSSDGRSRMLCNSELYYKKYKDSKEKGPFDWNSPSIAILEVSPDGQKVGAKFIGRHPSYYKEGFTSYRHSARTCLGPDGQIVQGFAMGGPIYVYNEGGNLIDSIPCGRIPIPEDEKHIWMDKIHTSHFFAREDMYGRICYDSILDCYLQHKSFAIEKSLADSLLAKNDFWAIAGLVTERQTDLEIIQRKDYQTLATLRYPFPSPILMRSSGKEIWVQSGKKIYHCRIVLDPDKL